MSGGRLALAFWFLVGLVEVAIGAAMAIRGATGDGSDPALSLGGGLLLGNGIVSLRTSLVNW